jgi:hypothetical protein
MAKKKISRKTVLSKGLSAKVEKALLYLTNPRIKDIIERRFGIKTGNQETLEAIGKIYKITRERVRQIEEAGLKILKSNKVISCFAPVFKYLDDLFADHGHIMGEDYLYCTTTGTNEANSLKGQIFLALTLGDSYERVIKDSKFNPYWIAHPEAKARAEKVLDSLMEHFKQNNKVFNESEILNVLSKKHSNLPEKLFCVILDIAKDIEKNNFGEIGLIDWPEISPQGVKDRAYLVLRKTNEPLHFTEITDLINKWGFANRPAYVQTVHNELIKDPRFVLVGRGTYALADWGYESGTVEELIEKILKNNKKPLTKKEILDKVLAQRRVKPNTIVLNLQRSPKFAKLGDGKYAIA